MHPYSPTPDPLTMPVGALVIHQDPVQVGSSIRVAAQAMAESGTHTVLVVEGTRLVGVLDEPSLLAALGQGIGPNEPVETVIDTRPLTIQPHMSGAEALRVLNESGRHAIAVVDVMGNAVGIVTPSRLFHSPSTTYTPQAVGGLATPFGVYLTNGVVSGGAKGLALVAAGAGMFLVFLIAASIVNGIVILGELDMENDWAAGAAQALSTLLFLVGLRASPIAGTHGAEHMVVHAIERGEALVPEVVRRMPRVHPRCGTNLAIGAMLFVGVFSAPLEIDTSLKLILAVVTTLFLWKPLGSFAQYYFTTKRPTDAQLRSGIRAGEELLAASARSGRRHPSVARRLVASGILHVIAGAMLAELTTWGVLALLQVPEAWRVIS